MSTHRRRRDPGQRRPRTATHRLLPIALGLALVGVAGAVGPSVVEDVTHGSAQDITLTALPKDAPEQGLVYDGLQPVKAGALCSGAYALDDFNCTYGPDTAPTGLTVRHDVAPVTAKAPAPALPKIENASVPLDAELARDQGGSALTPDAPALVPEPAPGDADFIMGTHDVACEGDGHDGRRVQVLYVQEFGTPSRYTDFLGSMRTWSAGVDQIFDRSAGETSGSRHVRFVTNPQCQVDVDEVQVPTGTLGSFTKQISALQKLGYNRTDRKYLMFTDANVYCGIATYVDDNRSGIGNRNNGGPSYGRVDAGCWSASMAAHELAHELGAVLTGSPNASGAGGCLDDYDLLCGDDRSGKAVRDVCPKAHTTRFDCGHDDYFSTDPKAGSYLATHWNMASSEFLLRSDGGDDIPDAGGPVPATGPSGAAATPAPTAGSATPSPAASPGPTSTDLPPSEAASTSPSEATPPTDEPLPSATTTLEPVADVQRLAVAAAPVQAVLEIRDATSSSVHLTWSAASDTADYEVFVDGQPIGFTKATRARLIGLRPDARYQVVVKTGSAYAAKSTAQTAPAARPAQNSWFLLANAMTGGNADLYAARTADGTPVTLGDSDGDAQQHWQLVPAGDNSYQLVSQATGKCAGPLNGDLAAGAPLVQGACTSDSGDRWILQASAFGFTLRTTEGDLVLGVGNQRFGAHRVLELQNADNQRHQSWTAVPD